jgi:hypothetical protein
MQSLSIEGGSWNRAELRPTLHRGRTPICFSTPIGRDRSRQTFSEAGEGLLPFGQVGIKPIRVSTLQKAVVFHGKKRPEEIPSE